MYIPMPNNDGLCALLLLGEGDFSFSLDVCRYLSLRCEETHGVNRVVCSGIDTLHQLQKYRDSSYILRELRSFHHPASLNISIHHEVNAIVPWDESNLLTNSTPLLTDIQFQYVIFNHPHLGKEDARLHHRFLTHFFYSVFHYWLARPSSNTQINAIKPGTIHLTLAKGQCERWNVLQSAQEQGLILLHRGPFCVPLLDTDSSTRTSQYKLRRHQNGQSFTTKIDGSETFIFGKKNEWPHPLQQQNDLFLLPWQRLPRYDDDKRKLLSCSACVKVFADERSLHKHMASVHSETRTITRGSFLCDLCPNTRSFSNVEALKNHQVAKHEGIYRSIKPDWAMKKNPKEEKDDVVLEDTLVSLEPCKVCSFRPRNEGERIQHVLELIPTQATLSETSCSKCNKRFRDQRSQFQHENFCVRK